MKLTTLLSVQSHLRIGGTKPPLLIFQQVSMLKLRKLEMFLLESVLDTHKDHLPTIYPQINKCASNLRQRLLLFLETVSGLVDLWPVSPYKAILYPGIAVELAEFHVYDLSLTDVKKYKIHTFSHTACKKEFEEYRISDVCISADRYTVFEMAYDFIERFSFHSQGKWCCLGGKNRPMILPCFCAFPQSNF